MIELEATIALEQELEAEIDSVIIGGAGGVGFVYVTDITPQAGGESVSDKTYQDSPNDTVIQTATTSTLDLIFSVRASYPIVTIRGTDYTLTRDAGESHYAGDISLTLASAGSVIVTLKTPDDASGAIDTVVLTLVLPPTITEAVFTGGYPGSQTELKEGDTYQLQVTADREFDQVVISDYEACQSSSTVVVSGLTATIDVTIADRGDSATLRPARVSVRDAVTGSYSSTYDTDSAGSVDGTNVVNCNNLHPSLAIGSVTYPGAQQALKGSESATVANTASDYDTIAYTSPNGDLSITNDTTYENPKTVTRISGSYNISTDNLQVSANRAANDATTTVSDVVSIANVAATVTVGEAAARLRSGGNDGTSAQNHTITISSNQQLLSTPSVDPDSGGSRGTFIGSWSGGPTSWTRSLQVHDDDEKGSFLWENLSATNLAGIATSAITGNDAYTLGGFVARTVTWDAFQTVSRDVNVEVVDFSKIQAGLFQATNQQSVRVPIGTAPSADPAYNNTYTIDAAGTDPHHVVWTDLDAAQSNSDTASLYDYEETV